MDQPLDYQLVNVAGASHISGAEISIVLRPHRTVRIRNVFSYAFGEGPNPAFQNTGKGQKRVPLSRIPPPNGNVEVSSALRWATSQTRLAPQDLTDSRIPNTGTPGFHVLDLRLLWHVIEDCHFALVAENLTNQRYRYHGSSINGAQRGIVASLEVRW